VWIFDHVIIMVIIFDPYTIHVDYPMIPCVSLIFVWLKTSAEQNSMIFPISRNILYNNYLTIVLVLSHMNPFPKRHPQSAKTTPHGPFPASAASILPSMALRTRVFSCDAWGTLASGALNSEH
jgi:hypothetical protein